MGISGESLLLFLIICIALAIRIYKIDEYAIFLSDQAIDSLATKGILDGNFTLLGPRASVGNFFNGPIVYYLMLPFFLLFKSDPLSGTIFQIVLQILTIPILYLLAKRFGGTKAAFFAILMFSVSPLFIYYSKSAFNSYPAILFTTICLYLLSFRNVRYWQMFGAGLASGMLVQMHYLLYVYAFLYFLVVVFKKNLKLSLTFLMGAILGISPMILFEVRNKFFNLRAIATHMADGGGDKLDLVTRLNQSMVGISQIFGANNAIIGFMITIFSIFGAWIIWNKFENGKVIGLSFLASLMSLVIYRGTVQPHYFIGIHVVVLLCTSKVFAMLPIHKYFGYGALVLVSSVILISNQWLFLVPKDQDGFSLANERKAVKILENEISKLQKIDPNLKWNITQDLQQDNRAMPMRYLLSRSSVIAPLDYTDYGSNRVLALVKKSDTDISNIKTWEFKSFGDVYSVYSQSKINEKLDIVIIKK